jgi:hypothetical protein
MNYIMVTVSERTASALGHQVTAPTIAEAVQTVARQLLKEGRSGDPLIRLALLGGSFVGRIPSLHEAAQGSTRDLARSIALELAA